MRKVVISALVLISCLAVISPAADLAVPNLELITRGYVHDGSFLLGTRGSHTPWHSAS